MSFKKNYIIAEQIGTGSMATVHKAVQKSLDRVVAVKLIHSHLAKDPDYVARFEREAKAAACLGHVNIMDIIDFGNDDELYYIVSEYIDGPDLFQVITESRELSLDFILSSIIQILNGLEHAHNKGIIHRDIKPANIMYSLDGEAKITDFGIAQASNLQSLTRIGQVLGTPTHMSPEQAQGKRLDHRSDLFSVGVILYEMLTHNLPFKGTTSSETVNKIILEPPVPLETMRPDAPKELAAIVKKALAKDPTNRYFDATEFAFDLEKLAIKSEIHFGSRVIQQYFKKNPDLIKKSVKQKDGTSEQVRQISPTTTGIGKNRPTVAILPLTGCFGCQINLLDLHDDFIDLHDLIDIKFSYIMDVKKIPKVDIGIVEGCVANSENEEILKSLRYNCDILIALGTCACFGGVPGLRNLNQVNNVIYRAYVESESTAEKEQIPGSPEIPALLEHVRPVSEVVKVDAIIPGCPSPHDLILNSLQNIIKGTDFEVPDRNLCYQCPRKHKEMLSGRREYISDSIRTVMEMEEVDNEMCFLEQGILCMGLSTREGCGARCVESNIPCRGCMGPAPHVKETGAKWINALGSLLPGGSLRFRHDLVGLCYRYTVPISMMPYKKV